jgi:hypothetical protein
VIAVVEPKSPFLPLLEMLAPYERRSEQDLIEHESATANRLGSVLNFERETASGKLQPARPDAHYSSNLSWAHWGVACYVIMIAAASLFREKRDTGRIPSVAAAGFASIHLVYRRQRCAYLMLEIPEPQPLRRRYTYLAIDQFQVYPTRAFDPKLGRSSAPGSGPD